MLPLFLDAATLPPSAPWWAGLVVVAITSAAGIVLALIQRRDTHKAEATAKELADLRAALAKALSRIDELEDDGTDPDVRASQRQLVEQRLTSLEEYRTKAERRAEEAAKVDLDIQRTLGLLEGTLGRVKGAVPDDRGRSR